MYRLVDKTILVLLCGVICVLAQGTIAPVIALLLVLVVSAFVQCDSGKKSAWCVLGIVSLLCCVFPPLFCAAPLLLYDALWEKKWWLAVPCFGALFSLTCFSPLQLALIAAGFGIALLLYCRSAKLEELIKRLHALRDTATEKTMLLKEKNKQLSEKQDYEIYLATLKERNRIAREIHDNVGHMLTRSLLQVGALQIINQDATQKEALDSLKETLDSAMTSIRSSVHNLHDDSIDLNQAVRECIKAVESRYQVQLEYDIADCASVPKQIKVCFLGVLKESLSNVTRHSNGNQIHITLREHPAFYQLAITDNGSCTQIVQSGIGLTNMQERAESVGGIIRFTPSICGFQVFLSAPKQEERSN